MTFDNEHKVIVETLSPEEAGAFIKFLESEILRHKEDIAQAQELIKLVKETKE